jgi:phasin family protein
MRAAVQIGWLQRMSPTREHAMDTPQKMVENAATLYVDALRTQFETGLALVNALVAGAERIREAQLDAARATRVNHKQIADRVAKTSSMQDLLALQLSLLNEYCFGSVRYWSQLAEIGRKTQEDVAGIVQKQGRQALAQAAAENSAIALPGSAEPLVAAMQSAINAARKANESFANALVGAAAPAVAKKPAKGAHARPGG